MQRDCLKVTLEVDSTHDTEADKADSKNLMMNTWKRKGIISSMRN